MSTFKPYSKTLVLDHQELRSALPPEDGIRGLYFNSMKALLAQREVAPIDPKRRIPFKMYSRGEYLDLAERAAQKLYPTSIGQGMYDIGAGIYPALLKSLVGKSIFLVAGYDFKRALSLAPRGFAASNVLGKVIVKELTEHKAHVEMMDVWNPTHMSIGVFLGAMEVCNVTSVGIEFLEHRPGHIEIKFEWKDSAHE